MSDIEDTGADERRHRADTRDRLERLEAKMDRIYDLLIVLIVLVGMPLVISAVVWVFTRSS